ncbi:MAG: threonine ammonia-lyase [Acidobacteriota bacterium]|nr:threonine ammonia-lyase [Acidobacteriota bacterium]
MDDVVPPSPDEIVAAAQLLEPVIQRTPVQSSASLSRIAGVDVWLKCENLQSGGSFKIRGAFVRMSRLSPSERAAGVLAASAGNHAQGVALAARRLGMKATIYMPERAALPKIAATEGYGAEVRLVGETIDEALVAAKAEAARTGQTIIHPFDHRDIVLGQATIGLEILEQVPGARHVLVPTGGGGLLAGIGCAIAAFSELGPQVIGVQAEGAAAYPESLRLGVPTPLGHMQTMADGIAVARPGDITLPLVQRTAKQVLTVSEEEIARALLLLVERVKLVVEPAGAVGVAALLEHKRTWDGPVVVVLSGGNIDPLMLNSVLQHGLAHAGRYLHLRFRSPDLPGQLARILEQVAALGANVLSVEHYRTSAALRIGEVEIVLELETRGPKHVQRIIAELGPVDAIP